VTFPGATYHIAAFRRRKRARNVPGSFIRRFCSTKRTMVSEASRKEDGKAECANLARFGGATSSLPKGAAEPGSS